ncbi:hypothetical protein AAG906_033646 [Vitis piasezkii]
MDLIEMERKEQLILILYIIVNILNMLTALCTTTRKHYRVENLNRLIYGSDVACMEQLRMDRHTFTTLCSMLRTIGKLKDSKYIDVEEMVALFLHILAHHTFQCSIECSHSPTRSITQKPEPVSENSTDERWKWFKEFVLKTCNLFMYCRLGGSTSILECLRCVSYYYLVDAGYTNGKGFLAPYRGQRYHLNDWREGHMPTTHEEFFNMKHSAARNVIERCFGLLKLRWAILRSPCFYPIKTQCKIILACCLIHNLIKRDACGSIGTRVGCARPPSCR